LVDYELYDINGLPPLKIQRIKNRNEIEKNIHVKSLIESKLLLNKDLNILLNNLINISDSILSFTKHLNKKPQDIFEKFRGNTSEEERSYIQFIFSNFYRDYIIGRKKIKNEDIIELYKLKLDEITRMSNTIQDELNKFEKKIGKQLDIVEHITIYICAKCKNILSLNKFNRGNCVICKNSISSSSKTEQISVTVLSRSVKKFFQNNWWLEEGISYLLKRQNLEVKTGLYILGFSGVIFILAGKMSELGCKNSILVTIATEVHPDLTKIAKSFNIKIIESVLEKEDIKIIEEMKLE